MAYNNVKVKARQVVAQSSTQTKDLGTVSEVPMGEWNVDTPYKKLNKVRYVSTGGSGVTLLAKKANQGVEPFVSQGWQEVWMVENYDGGAVIPNGTYPDMTVGNSIKAENDGTGNNIANQFSEVVSDIQGLREDINTESHFRGMFESVEALRAAYPTATPNDYAYIVGGNIYIWQNNAWTNSGQPSPNTAVPASNATPLMNGVASAGTSSQYSRGDHRHPTDTSKVKKSGDTMTGNLKVPALISADKPNSKNTPLYILPYVPFTEIAPSHNTVDYLKALLKWICRNYPNVEGGLWLGRANPNSAGQIIIDIYDTSEVDGDGMPKYCCGTYRNLLGDIVTFNTNVYTFTAFYSPTLLSVYPVGSIYISVKSTSPAQLFGGSWTAIRSGHYLQAVTSGAGLYGIEGLPNITGSYAGVRTGNGGQPYAEGALYMVADTVSTLAGGTGDTNRIQTLGFDASRSDLIYGRSETVTPLHYRVYMWRRTA